jgi:hypothetical protein
MVGAARRQLAEVECLRNGRFWLGAVYFIAVIERPLYDPIADVRASELE